VTDPALNRLNLSAAIASVAVALTLVGLKLWALLATGAISVAASLTDSALDLIVSGAAAVAVIYAARPPDDDHAFGHTSVEDLAALGQALFVAAAALAIGIGAAQRLITGPARPMAAETVGIAIMAGSAVLTLALVWWQGRVARLTGSRVIAADRLHYMGDLLPTLGALVALLASARWGLWQVDSIVALVAAAIMLRGAAGIGRAAWDALMDRRADPAILAGIGRIADGWPGVRGWHDLKTRTAGSRIFVHLHIELDGDQSLSAAHEIGAALRRAIIAAYPQADVIIHKDVAQAADAAPPVSGGHPAPGRTAGPW
jgi:ferrous-iron efflux pump FieF